MQAPIEDVTVLERPSAEGQGLGLVEGISERTFDQDPIPSYGAPPGDWPTGSPAFTAPGILERPCGIG